MVALMERIQARTKTWNKIRGLTIDKMLLAPWPKSDLTLWERFDTPQPNPEWEKLVEDESRTFREELLPLYREMLDCFTKHMWLAESTTRDQYSILVECLDLWERIFAGLPQDMAQRFNLGITRAEALEKGGERLEPLLNDLRIRFDGLQRELKAESPNKHLRLRRNEISS